LILQQATNEAHTIAASPYKTLIVIPDEDSEDIEQVFIEVVT